MGRLVSVLIDTYNHERFIEQAIVSALEQDFPPSDREIIVVDDGSTDATPEIIHRFEPRVRLLRKRNGGQASAFNIGVSECSGELVAFLDGDDWWLPGKLGRVTDILASDGAVGLVGHGYRESREDGSERDLTPRVSERFKLNSLAAAQVFRLRKSYLGTSRMTLRLDLAKQLLPIPEQLVIEADEYVFTLAAAMAEIVILQTPLTCYRVHGGNLYLAGGGSPAGLRRKQKVMANLADLLRRDLTARALSADAVACVVEIVRAEADQMRLMLDGGTRCDTLRTERAIYNIMHGDARTALRLFRSVAYLAALILPPRRYYSWRRWIASRRWYRSIRSDTIPPPMIAGAEAREEYLG